MDGIKPIQVFSAQPLDGAAKMKIELAFSGKHTEPVSFVYVVKPELIGGILVNDNEVYYDATVKGQLDKIKHIL